MAAGHKRPKLQTSAARRHSLHRKVVSEYLFRSHSNRRCMKVPSFTVRDASAMRRSSPGRMRVL